MKSYLILLLLFVKISTCCAQYDKEKLIKILTEKSWFVTGTNAVVPEKTYSFNKDMTVQIGKENGTDVIAPQKENWSISSSDQIRWFLTIGKQTQEMIISYTKSGSQFVKLSRKEASGTTEINLFPMK